MSFTIRRAERKALLGRIALCGPSGAGKTYGALKLAKGLAPNGLVIVISTEREADKEGVDIYDGAPGVPEGDNFQVLSLRPPHSPERYVEAIKFAEKQKPAVIIIDSLTHAWAGSGGALEIKEAMDNRGGGKSSFSNWRHINKMQLDMINTILAARSHVIVTMRSKTEWVTEKDEKTGKTIPRKVGLTPIQRDGLEYEFTVIFEIGVPSHVAYADKARTVGLFDNESFIIENETGAKLRDFLDKGKKEEEEAPVQAVQAVPAAQQGPPAQATAPPQTPVGVQAPVVGKALVVDTKEVQRVFAMIVKVISQWPVNLDDHIDGLGKLMSELKQLPEKKKLLEFDQKSIDSLYNHIVDVHRIYNIAFDRFAGDKKKAEEWLNTQSREIQGCDYFDYRIRSATVKQVESRSKNIGISMQA